MNNKPNYVVSNKETHEAELLLNNNSLSYFFESLSKEERSKYNVFIVLDNSEINFTMRPMNYKYKQQIKLEDSSSAPARDRSVG